MSEQRAHKRKLVNASIKLFHDSFGEIDSVARDISNGGVFVIVQPEHEIPVGDELKMTLQESSDTNVIFNMKVMRHDKGGMGLMFLDFEVDGQSYEMKNLNKFWSR
ncbi:MAG: PilZ domain-containing protein [Gammaproteobacteria bacterium]|jgi:hypothetical protein